MHSLLAFAGRKLPQIKTLLRECVECESPSGDPAAIARFADLIASAVKGSAEVKAIPNPSAGPHLRIEFATPGSNHEGQILALGHSDTVWPIGTLKSMPFRESDGRLWGPGVLDMKAGIVFFLFAMEALRELDVPSRRRIVMQLNGDEETGSESSRALTESEAARSAAVLVLEPGTGLAGKLKTARKGVGDYTVTVRGRAAHAGVDFESGASAVLELARQVLRISAFTDLERGITVNAGLVAGGTRTNVIAAEARAEVDIRMHTATDAAALDRAFRELSPVDPRCTVHVEGGLNRPPMERTPAIAALFARAKALAMELGVSLEESATGGGSDGNFTAALGVPTLDGLGAVGEGAHATHESILVERIADRIALLALLAANL